MIEQSAIPPMRDLRKMIITAAAQAGEGHIPSALSVLDILWVLYDRVLNIDPANPRDLDRDRFILSKGQASLGLYAVLSAKGFFPVASLESFATYSSMLGGHPDRNKVPGVESSTGALGHGLPMGVGMALGLRVRKSPARVVVLIGDGEANEGTVWESALLASHHSLSNLLCIVDYNHSTDRALTIGDCLAKFKEFGWDSHFVRGHDHDKLCEAFKRQTGDRPMAIIAETTKGYGCRIMENNPEWHHKAPMPGELPDILKALL